MKLFVWLATSAMLSGCAGVEARYADAPAFDQVGQASASAAQGLSYYTLAKIHVAAAPTPASPAGGQKDAADSASAPAANTAGADPAVTGAPQGKDLPAAAAPPAPTTAKKAGGGKSSGAKPAGKPAAAAPAVADAGAATAPVAKPKPVDSTPPADPAPNATVGGKVWTLTLSAESDNTHGFMMGGTSGFWRKTTITASRALNSDRPQSVTVKAENLTATRLGQIATVLGYVVSPAGAVSKDLPPQGEGPPPADDLLPFDFYVSQAAINKETPTRPGSSWTYRLAIDAPQPAGAVGFGTFITTAKTAKAVNYFPVPACLVGHLYVSHGGQQAADFPLVVSDPGVVRLEPLPLDGKLTLSPICSSSVEGATQVDRYDEVFSDLAALQKAYVQVTKPDGGASTTGKTSTTPDATAPAAGGDATTKPKAKAGAGN